MEWQQMLRDLIGLVKEAAPALWMVARRQVYVETMGRGILLLIMLIAATGLFVIGRRGWAKRETLPAGDEDNYFTLLVISSFLYLLSLFPFYAILARLINPDYYAIKILMNYVK